MKRKIHFPLFIYYSICKPFLHKIWGILFVVMLVGCKSIETPIDRKIISDTQYKEVLHVTNKKVIVEPDRLYYWFKSQEVHRSQGSFAGVLLDGEYIKYYYSNQLAEKGNFSKGLKSGTWISWHENGKVLKIASWENGKQIGKVTTYNNLGDLTSIGKYNNGLKTGKWIYPVKGDTLIYKKGKEIIADSILVGGQQKKSFFKKIFSKKNKDQVNTKETKKEKPGFFKRLFRKKNKTEKQKNKEKKEGFFKRLFKGKKINEDGVTKQKKVKKPKIKKTVQDKNLETPNFFQRLFRKKEKKTNNKQKND